MVTLILIAYFCLIFTSEFLIFIWSNLYLMNTYFKRAKEKMIFLCEIFCSLLIRDLLSRDRLYIYATFCFIVQITYRCMYVAKIMLISLLFMYVCSFYRIEGWGYEYITYKYSTSYRNHEGHRCCAILVETSMSIFLTQVLQVVIQHLCL